MNLRQPVTVHCSAQWCKGVWIYILINSFVCEDSHMFRNSKLLTANKVTILPKESHIDENENF